MILELLAKAIILNLFEFYNDVQLLNTASFYLTRKRFRLIIYLILKMDFNFFN